MTTKPKKTLHLLTQRQENGPLMDAIIAYKATNRRIFIVQVGKLSFLRENVEFKLW